MEHYYLSIVFITFTLMITLIFHLQENETLSARIKNHLRNIAELIILGTICEFIGLYLNSNLFASYFLHKIVKIIELSISPIIPFLFLKILKGNNFEKKFELAFIIFIFIHAIIEFANFFIPITFSINHSNIYFHEKYYCIYVFSYGIGIIYGIYELITFTKRNQSRNILTILSTSIFIISGFFIRFIDYRLNTDWLVTALILMMFIIFYSDMRLKVDSLTSLLNRKSYDNRLRNINYSTALIILDANNFKTINDTYGHQCGDMVLKAISKTILRAYGKYGYCYRIGGDEFCIILRQGKLYDISKNINNCDIYKAIQILNNNFDLLLDKQIDKYPMLKSGVSKGFGIYIHNDEYEYQIKSIYSSSSIQDVVKIADNQMYENKVKNKISR